MTATAQLLPNVYQTWTDSNGNPLSGGQLFSYIAGTSTAQATYTDETATTPNTNPVILSAAGKASVWLRCDLAYKLIMQDSNNNVLWTADNVSIVNPASIDKTKIAANIAGAALLQNGTGAIDVQVDNATIQIVGNQLQVKPGGITASTFSASSKLEIVVKNVRDLSCPGIYEQIPQYEWSSPTLLSNPSTIPAGGSAVTKWSPNGEFLAVGCSVTPFIYIYQRSGTTLTKLANPVTLPTGTVFDLTWSPCGDFLAITHHTAPNITIYQRSGNSFTKLANPASLPSSSSVAGFIAFSPNSDFLALSNVVVASPWSLILYERSGTTFTDVTTASTLSGIGNVLGWSGDSSLFAAVDTASGNLDVFQRTDAVFSGITPPALPTGVTGNVSGFAFSPDGNYLAVASSVSPYLALFSAAGGVFSLLTNPATVPTSPVNCVAWSANSEYLILGFDSTPFIMTYQVSGSTFTKIADPSTVPGNIVVSAHWTPTKQFLAIIIGASPYLQVYETASVLPSNALLWSREAPSV